MSLRSHVERQFGRPEGLLGRLAGAVMARRPSNRRRNAWAVELLGVEPGQRVLEVGFGPGLALAEIAVRIGRGLAVGIDHSEAMLAMAEARNAKALRDGRMELRVGGLELLSGMASGFDRILSVNVVQFWADRRAALAALAGALRPDGRIVTAYQPRHKGASRADSERMAAEIADIQRALGFRRVRTEWLELEVPAAAVIAECNGLTRAP